MHKSDSILTPTFFILKTHSLYFQIGAGIAQWLRARRSGVRIPAEAGNFYLPQRVQTASGTHPAASYPTGNRVSFPGCKEAGE